MSQPLSRLPATGRLDDEAPRLDRAARHGHVESWFLRANDPTRPRAVWLRSTVRVPVGGRNAVAEVWCAVFDGEAGRTWATRRTVALEHATLGGQPLVFEAAGARFVWAGEGGTATGELADAQGRCRFDLRWQQLPGPLGAPLSLAPARWLVDGPVPRSKLLTPLPVLLASGRVELDGAAWALDGWPGMQGHNWGREHASRYAWGQCVFPAADGQPPCMVEGFSARVKLAGLRTPWLSALVVRRGEQEWRFDRLVDVWRQQATFGDLTWQLRLRGRDGEALLALQARPASTVCLAYDNPDGSRAWCLNSKLASALLRVRPAGGEAFECHSPHGGALELLQPDLHPLVPPAVS